mmetsp:Transcript_91416/g.255328  ORF Transcript_91416/g.255328 Transcript_91416/m.255328 type:complete len:211 (-) Transcript_91416:1069-1701(-)
MGRPSKSKVLVEAGRGAPAGLRFLVPACRHDSAHRDILHIGEGQGSSWCYRHSHGAWRRGRGFGERANGCQPLVSVRFFVDFEQCGRSPAHVGGGDLCHRFRRQRDAEADCGAGVTERTHLRRRHLPARLRRRDPARIDHQLHGIGWQRRHERGQPSCRPQCRGVSSRRRSRFWRRRRQRWRQCDVEQPFLDQRSQLGLFIRGAIGGDDC